MTVTTLPHHQPPVDELGDELCSLAGQIAAATGRFLSLLADFDTREGWGGAGVLSCAHWLSWRCGMDRRTARDHVRVARALTVLPRTATELDAGRLSYSKVRAVTRVATPETEDDLVDIALTAPAAHVERLVRGLRTCSRQDERGDVPTPRRHVQHRWDADTGDLIIWGRLASTDGALLLAALTRAEHERTRTDGSAEPPDLTAGAPSDLGPALVAVAEMTCAAVTAPPPGPSAPRWWCTSICADPTWSTVPRSPKTLRKRSGAGRAAGRRSSSRDASSASDDGGVARHRSSCGRCTCGTAAAGPRAAAEPGSSTPTTWCR